VRQSHHTIRAGSTSKSLLVIARSQGGEPVTGLRHDTPGASAGYARESDPAARRVDLVAPVAGSHVPGGFAEVDPDTVPGVYRLDVPDELLAPGSTHALLVLPLPGAVVEPVELAIVAYDPQDDWCMGVEGLANRRRHEFLRRALPRLTEMELALGEGAEARLSARLASDEEG